LFWIVKPIVLERETIGFAKHWQSARLKEEARLGGGTSSHKSKLVPCEHNKNGVSALLSMSHGIRNNADRHF